MLAGPEAQRQLARARELHRAAGGFAARAELDARVAGGGRPGGGAGGGRHRAVTSARGGTELRDWQTCARCYRIWDRGSIDKTAVRGRAAPVPFAPATREAVFTLALFVIPLGPWAEEQVVPDGMGTDSEPPAGPHLLSLADVGVLGFDCALKPAPLHSSGTSPTDLNTPVTTSDLPAFFPSLLEPPPISGGCRLNQVSCSYHVFAFAAPRGTLHWNTGS